MEISSLISCALKPEAMQLSVPSGVSLSCAAASAFESHAGPMLIICEDSFSAAKLQADLSCINPEVWCRIFPEWETLPYDALSPHQDIISERLEILAQVPLLKTGILIAPLPALMSRLCPPEFIRSQAFVMKKGDRLLLQDLSRALCEHGYLKVKQVLEHGEFSIRGSIIDIFPTGSRLPYRIDFFDDEVDSIRTFDLESQRSQQEIKQIKLLPAHEFPLDEEGIAAFRTHYRTAFPGVNLKQHVIYQAISKGTVPAGIEYYLPLFSDKSADFFDYLTPHWGIVCCGKVTDEAVKLYTEAQRRAHELLGNADHPPLPVNTIFISPEELAQKLQTFDRLLLNESSSEADANPYCRPLPELALDHHAADHALKLKQFINDFSQQGGRILLTAVSEGRRQALLELLPASLRIQSADSFKQFLHANAALMLAVAPFVSGAIFTQAKLAIITETEIFGTPVIRQRQRRSKNSLSQDAIIKNLAQLTEGQLVVHADHGIGCYRGLKTMQMNGITGEFLCIEYAGGDILNIPITALNLVARYSGSENPPLSKLGSGSWSKRKQKAAQKVRDAAAELLDLYARRAARGGIEFKLDEKALSDFCAAFPYEETPDQKAAIDAVLQDMRSGKPMDRLICGDVGFGKTEVAMRAAFVAAHAGKQAAVLVPTTILAEQHFQSFKDRFAGTALIIEELSRFKTAAEQKAILQRLKEGKIDIIIGTHRLLSSTVKFKDLGLVIIDEEHRFGVRQKEKLKELRSQVDLLTLTATPIPRTLNMAMEGMRDLSIIATPPEHRLAIKTFVHENNDQICREAIMRELRRGGQVYYLHNDVSSIERRAEELAKLVPEAKIEIGHGQMGERELQKVMRDFYHQRFNLLLCSTIIENGLDIAAANTIIIDRADLLGLAQLHQIRGRVGRSHHQAYAYLFTPPRQLLSRDAKRRLEAIAALEELGAGFVLATHDLEIRGAGELLGEEQSGQIESVGFTMYMEMLSAAVKALQEGREPSLHDLTQNECEIDPHMPAFLPESLIDDINTRLSFYKRLSAAPDAEALDELKIELIDRYGLLPGEALNLIAISKLKLKANQLGIKRIAGDGQGGMIEFRPECRIDPNYLVQIMQNCKHNEYRLSGPATLSYRLPETKEISRLQLLDQLLSAFSAHQI